MIPIFALAFVSHALTGPIQTASIKVHNVPAAKIAAMAAEMNHVAQDKTGAFEIHGVQCRVSDSSNELVLQSTDADQLKSTQSELSDLRDLLDLRPKSIEIKMAAYSAFYHRLWTSVVTVPNMTTAVLEDKDFGLKFEVTPRLKGDGAIAVSLEAFSTVDQVFLGSSQALLGPTDHEWTGSGASGLTMNTLFKPQSQDSLVNSFDQPSLSSFFEEYAKNVKNPRADHFIYYATVGKVSD